MKNKKINVVDFFAGAGGLSYGFYKDDKFKIEFANEIISDIAKTYTMNHPDVPMYNGDIADIDKSLLKQYGVNYDSIDVVIGGPPCQSYSTLGKRLMDDRANLFNEYFRIIKLFQPKVFIYENVKGLLSMQKGELVKKITNLFETAGYKIQWKILNAADYGVPQTRKRVIIVGTKTGFAFSFPKESHKGHWRTFEDATSDLHKLIPGSSSSKYKLSAQNELQKFYRQNDPKLEKYESKDFPEKTKKLMKALKEGGTKKDLPIELMPSSGFGNSYSKLWSDKPSTTITRNFTVPSSSRCIHPTQSRALSIREGARLQSFPDDYIFYGTNTNQKLAIGNAVPPLLSIALSTEIKKAFE